MIHALGKVRPPRRYDAAMPKQSSAEKKQAAELEVAQVFCAWYSRTQGVPCAVVRSLKEPAPDVLIRVGTFDVAMELARYREQGVYNKLHSSDRDFKSALSDRFGQFGRNRLPRCTPLLSYRERAGQSGHYTIPKRGLWPTIGDELIALMRAHKKPRGSVTVTPIRFKPDAELAKYTRFDRNRRYVTSETYPTLSAHCTGVDLRWHPGVVIGRPSTSMNARFGRTDLAEMERAIHAKLANLATYRAEVPGIPIWLLYYAEGHTPTGRLIGMDQCARVVEHLRLILSKHPGSFDAVWWANETSALRGPDVYKIV